MSASEVDVSSNYKAKILVVDDENELAEAIATDLLRKGYWATTAKNGKEGFAALQQGPVQIVISDIRMPGGDGMEFLDAIMKLPETRPIVFLMTGFSEVSVAEAYERGAAALFPKPFDRRMMHQAIERVLKPTQIAAASRKHERMDAAVKVMVNLAAEAMPVVSKTANLGRGGLFVALEGKLPTVGETVSITILSSDPQTMPIRAKGVVRWVREDQSQVLPRGCGIEYSEVSEENSNRILEMVNMVKTIPYIPWA